jgi:anaerobic magnesium-protoporphyrin IX monomethyl ester cyclase
MIFKVVLIQPKAPDDLSLGPTVAGAEHLGLGYLAAYLEAKGIWVRIINAEANRLEPSDVVQQVRGYYPNVVGLSPASVTIQDSLRIAGAIKLAIGSFVVLGGHLASACAREILLNEPPVDAVIVGDGELPLWQLCNALRDKSPLTSVPSLVFREQEKIIETKAEPDAHALDDLPFPKRDLPSIREGGHARMLTSRGCPYRCSFCTTPGFYERRVRYRSASNVVDEMEILTREYGVRHFWMSDDIYVSRALASRRHAAEIAEQILRRKLKITYRILCRADSFEDDDELLLLLKASGLTTIFLGLESGSDRILTKLNKDLTAEQNLMAVRQLHRAEIALQIGFIMFSPYSLPADLRANASFLKRVGEFYRFFPASRAMDVFPGTSEASRLRAFGLLNNSFSYRSVDNFDYCFQNREVGELARTVKEIYGPEANSLDHHAYSLMTHSLPRVQHKLGPPTLNQIQERIERCNELNYGFFVTLLELVETGTLNLGLARRLNRHRMDRQSSDLEIVSKILDKALVAPMKGRVAVGGGG